MTDNKSVDSFAKIMKLALKSNKYKGHWRDEDNTYLLQSLKSEIVELENALIDNKYVQSEAADVANFAMMIADNAARGLE